MNYGSIKVCDTANGPGMRVSLFVSGCTHHCKGCFNEVAWDFGYGNYYTMETENYILSMLAAPHMDGLSVLGGEPMNPFNQASIVSLVTRAHWMGKSVWVYTGYTWEELQDPQSGCRNGCTDLILDMVDVLVDGRFVEAEKDISLQFRGSRNQRLIDVPKTLEAGKVVLWEEK